MHGIQYPVFNSTEYVKKQECDPNSGRIVVKKIEKN